jgi:hypothetical protein
MYIAMFSAELSAANESLNVVAANDASKVASAIVAWRIVMVDGAREVMLSGQVCGIQTQQSTDLNHANFWGIESLLGALADQPVITVPLIAPVSHNCKKATAEELTRI